MAEPEDIKGLRSLAEIKRAPIIVEDNELLLSTGLFEQLQRVAHVMASCETMPEFLRGKVGDCFRVAEQAFRWKLSPFLVAEKCFFVKGKIAYEGQLIAAVINSRAGLDGRLRYHYEGDEAQPKTLSVTVTGRFLGDTEDSKVTVYWETGYGMSRGARDMWVAQPSQQLGYYAARVWARRHAPEVILGAYTPEEVADERMASARVVDITPEDKPKDKLSQLEATLRRAKEGVGPATEVKLEDLGQNSGQPEEQHYAGKFYKETPADA